MLTAYEERTLRAIEARFASEAACAQEKVYSQHYPQAAVERDRQLRLRLHYPQRDTARLQLVGAVDLTNTERVREVIHSRLRSQLRVLELDLSGVDFLSLSGARMLAHTADVAPVFEKELRILPNLSRAARTVLRLMGSAPDRAPAAEPARSLPASLGGDDLAGVRVPRPRHNGEVLASTYGGLDRTRGPLGSQVNVTTGTEG